MLIDLSDSDVWLLDHRLRCKACGRDWNVHLVAYLFPGVGEEPILEVTVEKRLVIEGSYMEHRLDPLRAVV